MLASLPRWLRITGRVLFVALGVLLCLETVALTYGPVKGWYHRTFHRPDILSSAFIEEADPNRLDEQRQKLLDTWKRKDGMYGVHRTVNSVEGTPIGITVVVQKGVATVILDYTHDSYGVREFRVRSPVALSLFARDRHISPHDASYLTCSSASQDEPLWF